MNSEKIIKAGEILLKNGTSQNKLEFLSKLQKVIKKTKQKKDYENAMQLALKLVINGAYGAFANQWFCFFNNDLAASITSTCRDLTQLMDSKNSEYWYTMWHKDKKMHEYLGVSNVKEITSDQVVSVYGDSITGDSIIRTNKGKKTIEELYNSCNETTNRTDKEVLKANFDSLNWTEEKSYHYSKVKNVIRHKVTKKKWKLKTKSGKEIIVTNDHSMIVFRSGVKLEIKPSEILKTDKILIYKENKKALYGETDTSKGI